MPTFAVLINKYKMELRLKGKSLVKYNLFTIFMAVHLIVVQKPQMIPNGVARVTRILGTIHSCTKHHDTTQPTGYF